MSLPGWPGPGRLVPPRPGTDARSLTRPSPSSSAYDAQLRQKVAVKKLSRPFQSLVHARRTYRELRLLQHLKHENVSRGVGETWGTRGEWEGWSGGTPGWVGSGGGALGWE